MASNIGGITRLGSVIYALVRCTQFLEEPSLLDDAQSIAKQITRARIADDRHFDVMDGSAGALLGLLALHKATGEEAILTQAIVCGEHLLAHRVDDGDGHPVWRGVDGNFWTGFPHGAAGIAYALLRLYAITRNHAYLAAAEEAIAFERSVFSPAARNWPDWKSDAPVYEVRWCHGATGIGIARLGNLAIHDSCETREEIAAALQTTLEYGVDEIDQLCCGNSGRIEFFLSAAQRLDRPDLQDTARQWATQIIREAENNGAYRLIPELPRDIHVPAFFRGTAGIGYTLLRLEFPDQLPSILIWE